MFSVSMELFSSALFASAFGAGLVAGVVVVVVFLSVDEVVAFLSLESVEEAGVAGLLVEVGVEAAVLAEATALVFAVLASSVAASFFYCCSVTAVFLV